MKKMQQEMSQIQKTRDPAERRKLMQEHWKSMMQGMQMMTGQMMMHQQMMQQPSK
jgi:hypothetical protein